MVQTVGMYGAFNTSPTGPSVVTEGIAHGVATSGVDVEIVTTGDRESHPHESVSVTNLPGIINSVPNFYRSKRRVARHVRGRDDIDLFHTLAGIVDGADIWTLQGIFADLDILVHCPSIIDSVREFSGANVYSLLKTLGLRRSDRIVATSPFVLRQARQYVRLTPHAIIPIGVFAEDRAEPESVSSPKRVLFPGRVEPKKGQRRVLRHLSPEADSYQIDIVGGVSDEAYGERLARRWQHRMHGFVPEATLDRFYRRADIVVVASEHENFGLTAIEALARGCALVITDLCGFASFDTADENAGTFVVSDGQEAADVVKRLVSSSDLQDHKRAAYDYSERFTWESIGAAYRDQYDRILTGGRGR